MSTTSTPDMADKPDLKQMANDLSSAIGKAEHKPGQWAQTGQSMGGICCPGEPFDISKPWAKEQPWANFSFKRDSWLAVAAVNALPTLMSLIAENEALKGPHDWLAEDLIKELVDNAQSFQENSGEAGEDPFVIVLLAAASRIRRQEVCIDRLRSENEALRKDSESYRLLSFCHGQGTLELVRSHNELCAEILRLKILAGEPVPPTPGEFIGPSPEGPTARLRRNLAAMNKGPQS